MELVTTDRDLVVEIDPVEAHSPEAVPTRAFECRVVGSDPGFDD